MMLYCLPRDGQGIFFPYLDELPDALAEDASFDDIHPTYRDRLMKWNGRWIAVTVDGDLFNGYFRKDLFENKQNRQDFKKQFNYELNIPETWKEYHDIAQFFTGRKDAQGNLLYGTSEAFAFGGQQFWDIFSRASAYTNHPDHPGAQFFHPETMAPQINNPGWIRAVTEYVDILQYCPPDAINFDIVKVREAFISGKTAMALDWGDIAQISADPEKSSIVGKVGFFVLPGTRTVWNIKKQDWDTMQHPHMAPFLAFGGWVAGVPLNSKHKKAAWDYIMWYTNPKNSLKDVVTSGTGINPYRFTHFTSIDAWTKALSYQAASEYLSVLQESLDAPCAALDLRLPGLHRYTRSFEIQLTRALKKEITIKAALNTVAQKWDEITNELGRHRQLSIYRSSMGLPPLNKNKFLIIQGGKMAYKQTILVLTLLLCVCVNLSASEKNSMLLDFPRQPQQNPGAYYSTKNCGMKHPNIQI
ncbi:MAG: multiple sugar transport system substrate-binding protein [Candidatus Magnetoglobus multicellularis str. Araruama]|uniref:Multiple sugar transport system substrate-binding protein n=1 Tax=Candidatus Magnetoglobus multicellularis str. Araruama TaxID=890399 RepID=A0A1V1PDI9_9BACT|nr:MAG: multiple sugar transport system substrate-binding protein [Candidatus Magnetoglobus multicellularis str. Araruama]